MKKILIYIACAVMALGSVSCTKTGFTEPEPSADGVTLRFLTTDLTKATQPGVGFENKIDRIDWFVFPFKADGSAVDSTATALLVGVPIIPGADENLNPSYSTALTQTQINTIFPTPDSKALVFAVANYKGVYPETITLNALLEIEVRSTFADGDRWPHPLPTTDESMYFVMTGSAQIDLLVEQTRVKLNRLASKVTVSFSYEEEIADPHDENLIWKPQYGGPEARVYLSNAIATTTLGGPLTRAYITDSPSTYSDGTRDIFEYSYDYLTQLEGDPVYYTYPASMEAGDDNQPYLKLVLPWYAYDKRDTSPNAAPVKQKEVYYKIALPLDALQESNRYYEYKVNVDIIGSDTEVEIAATYSVKNWFNNGQISSNMATGKYISLDIPKNEYDMYSELLQILFVASGDVELIVDEISQDYLGSSTSTIKMVFMEDNTVTAGTNTILVNNQNVTLLNYKKITANDVSGWVSLNQADHILQISHEMNTQMTTTSGGQTIGNTAFDMTPYVYTITLHLVDAGEDTTFDRTIKITQYPSLNVISKRSNGYVWVNNYSNQRGGERLCFDDRGQNNTAARLGNLYYAYNAQMGTTDNSNPNNYIITASMLSGIDLPEVGKPVIGDPRDPTVNNLSNLSGLSKYHPTLTTGTQNIVSPKFIVSSSYNVLNSGYAINKEAAEKRCASYQENGYPAGRWRVPTAAEVLFMVTLSKFGFIPSLFNVSDSNAGYWSANGLISGSGSGEPTFNPDDTSTLHGIRCVYDAWYWGEEQIDNNDNPTTTSPATTWRGFKD